MTCQTPPSPSLPTFQTPPSPSLLAFQTPPSPSLPTSETPPPASLPTSEAPPSPHLPTFQTPPSPSAQPALKFDVSHQQNRARVAELRLPHGVVKTPIFMPVGTHGALKGILSSDLSELGPRIILGNTYHLSNHPGASTVESGGGLHNYMRWPHNLLTDSGGFQMVSLLKLAEITEEGVTFMSPSNQSKMLLTPEKSIEAQNSIGADIIMALDDVVSSTAVDRKRFEESTHRTTRWLDRCIAAHKNKGHQNLFGIVQGGLYADLRSISLNELKRRELPGYAIGGVSGGEQKDSFWRVIDQCTTPPEGLPSDRPRYVMGVGYVIDILVCVALGCDMFDSVYPCRTARFGTALVETGTIRLKLSRYAADFRPIAEGCGCYTCQNYSRAVLHNAIGKMADASQLLTIHNIWYMMRFCEAMQEAIKSNMFVEFVRTQLRNLYDCTPPFNERVASTEDAVSSVDDSVSTVQSDELNEKQRVPKWVYDALLRAAIDVGDLM